MFKKIGLLIFVLIIFSTVLINAQDENTFTVTKTENTVRVNSVNGNSLSKLSALSLNQIKVNFITNPTGSDLYIDNINYGTTPKSVYLSPGSHQVRISKSGFFTAQFNIFIKSNFEYTYTVKMYPGNGTPIPFLTNLRIANSFPKGLNVSFIADVSGGSGAYRYSWNFGDGSSELTTTNTILHTYARKGKYIATVTVRDIHTSLTSTSFRAFTLGNVAISNLNGTLKIISNPKNATITLNGINYGRTPKNISLAPGRYIGVLSSPGYYNRNFIITIRKGSTYNLRINLRHIR